MQFKLIGKKWINSSFHKKECGMANKECLKKDCLHPHDYGYRLSSGKWRERLVCLTRERGGCK